MNVKLTRLVKGKKTPKIGNYKDKVVEWKIDNNWYRVGMLDVGLVMKEYKNKSYPKWLKFSIDFLKRNEDGLYPKPHYLGRDYVESFWKQMLSNSSPNFLNILCINYKLNITKTIYHKMCKNN